MKLRKLPAALCALVAVPPVLAAVQGLAAQSRVLVVNAADDQRDDGCDAAHCTLREALRAAHQVRGAIVRFDLPAPYTIVLRSPLPPIGHDMELDGSTQRGAQCPMPGVRIDGSAIRSASPVHGLTVTGDGNRIRGIAVTNFSGHGVLVRGSRNVLQCMFVGVDLTGMHANGNAGHGIAVAGGHSNRIGGPGPEDANLLSANGGQGLRVEDALNPYLDDNFIGVDLLGRPNLPNLDSPLPALLPPPRTPAADPRATEQIMDVVSAEIEAISDGGAQALEDARLFETYLQRILREPVDAPPPSNLAELVATLHLYPAISGDLVRDVSAVLGVAREDGAYALARLFRTFSPAVPSLGRQETLRALGDRDLLSEALSAFGSADYVTSDVSPQLTFAEADGGPPTIPHLRWRSMRVFGPTSFNTPPSQLQLIDTCVGALTLCTWPLVYDLRPRRLLIVWESATLSQQQIDDIVQQNDYLIELRVNGQLLTIGPKTENPPSWQGYSAASFPGDLCPPARLCIGTELLLRHAPLVNTPPPWTIELKVLTTEALPFPVIIDIDPYGNPVFATHTKTVFAEASRLVNANPGTGGQKWFTEALYDTFKHPRCADCHSFETPAGIAAHHSFMPSFIEETNLHLKPSLYVPGAHVMACEHCHYNLPWVDPDGKPWHELDWRAPYQDLDVNWSQKNEQQICARVKANLPTEDLRFLHFHGDARLFWAVEDPSVLGKVLPSAPPHDYDEFLRRFDIWNYFGAPCP